MPELADFPPQEPDTPIIYRFQRRIERNTFLPGCLRVPILVCVIGTIIVLERYSPDFQVSPEIREE